MDSNIAAPSPLGERLHEYERQKLELASILRQVLLRVDAQKDQKDYEAHRRCQEILARLAEDRFTLAVVGQFSRGKSSLMNAIMGLDRLPVGLVPLTSVITKVAYGNPERALVEYHGHRLKSEIALKDLPQYVTETGNRGNEKGIASVEVQLPSVFLRRGFYFVDTPGVGSVITANTATTRAFLPNADAVIFVTSFDSPLGREELAFLTKVREYVEKIFFVVNKSDLVSEEERKQVLSFLRDRLRAEIPESEPRVFPVSALVGLHAKLSDSTEHLSESGLPELEQSLVEFLTADRRAEFLTKSCDLAILFVRDLRARYGDSPADRELREEPSTAEKGSQDTGVIPKATWTTLLGRLEDFRKGATGEANGDQSPDASHAPLSGIGESQVMQATRKSCRVCSATADAMFRYMAKFQYEILVDPTERSRLADQGGMCSLHTWQYAEISSPQGISGSYGEVLRALSHRLQALAEGKDQLPASPRVKKLIPGSNNCSACHHQKIIQDEIVDKILDGLATASNTKDAPMPVLCLPHLVLLLEKVRDPALAQKLIEFESLLLERLSESMERYALKHDALRRHLQSEDEEIAYHRAISQLVGDKRLQSPWRVEYLL